MNGHPSCLCRAGKTAGVVAAFLLLSLASPAFAHRIEKRFTVETNPVVSVRNKSGRITVKSWQRPEVLVVATHVSQKTEVAAEQMGNRVDLVTHLLSENVSAAELEANYEITVPEQAELQIRNDSGDVVVEHVSGDMTFDTVAAGVELQEVAGSLVVKTVSGSLTCIRCAGRIEVNSISGSFRLVQPVSSNVRAQTYSGNIFFDGAFQRGGTYILKNYTGTIEVLFSQSDSFDLSANSMQGTVENDAAPLKPFTHGTQRSVPRFAGSFVGTYNQGQARVELSSFSGTIKIRKRE